MSGEGKRLSYLSNSIKIKRNICATTHKQLTCILYRARHQPLANNLRLG